jgi:hypothetical protein
LYCNEEWGIGGGMNLFKRLFSGSSRIDKNKINKNFEKNTLNPTTIDEEYRIFETGQLRGDSYLLNAWVNIAVNI